VGSTPTVDAGPADAGISDASVPDTSVPFVDSGAGVSDAGSDGATDDAGSSDGGATTTPSQYLVATAITVNDALTTYLKATASIDAANPVSLDIAREFPDYVDVMVREGKVFVFDRQQLTVTRYAADASGIFNQEGQLNFSAYSITSPQWAFVSATQAYLRKDGGYVRWNPSALTIDAEYAFENPGAREGIEPTFMGGSAFRVRGNRLYHAVSYFDDVDYKSAQGSSILVFDTDNGSVVSLLDADCPDLEVGTEDAGGDLYFSAGPRVVAAAIYNGAPSPCVVRIRAGTDVVDANFTGPTMATTGGHHPVAMQWLDDTRYLLGIFHEEKYVYSPAISFQDWVYTDAWTFGVYDVATAAYNEVPALGTGYGYFNSTRVDARFYLATTDLQGSATTWRRLLPDGSALPSVTVQGFSTQMFRLR
jgi:hypothetical protein